MAHEPVRCNCNIYVHAEIPPAKPDSTHCYSNVLEMC